MGWAGFDFNLIYMYLNHKAKPALTYLDELLANLAKADSL